MINIPSNASTATHAQHDFKVVTSPQQGRVILVYGYGGTGKTTFATRFCPSPIFVISFDGRSVDASFKDNTTHHEVQLAKIPYPEDILRLDIDAAKDCGKRVFDRFMINFDYAMSLAKDGRCRTICIDTATELDEIMQFMTRGRLDKAEKDYGASKNLMKRQLTTIASRSRSTNCNLILTARAREKWNSNGEIEPVGLCNDTLVDLSDIALHIRIAKPQSTGLLIPNVKPAPVDAKFEVEVRKAGAKISELFKVYTEDDWSVVGGPFVYCCMLQWPDHPIETWM